MLITVSSQEAIFSGWRTSLLLEQHSDWANTFVVIPGWLLSVLSLHVAVSELLGSGATQYETANLNRERLWASGGHG